MRLRGRFALWFAIAAVVPIAAAALVTREYVATSFRDDYLRTRAAAETAMRHELARHEALTVAAAESLANKNSPFTGVLLLDLINSGGQLDSRTRLRHHDAAEQMMRGLGLQVLLVTDRADQLLIAPHDNAAVGEKVKQPRTLARREGGGAVYTFEAVITPRSRTKILVTEAAAIARDGGQEAVVLVGREINADLVKSVRRTGQIDARLVAADGRELVAPAESGWGSLGTSPLRVALAGPDGETVAWIEIAVWDKDLTALQNRVSLIAAVGAAAALILTIFLGAYIAGRITRGLDLLVAGAQAAAKGDLDHRVPVTGKDEVGEVGAAFNLMMEDLRSAGDRLAIAERIAAWQEIARRLAHEIKNPLTPIQMSMDTLRKVWRKQHKDFGDILEESTTTVLEEVERLKKIVSEFSDFARLPKPAPAPTDLNEVVASALALYQGATPVEPRLAERLPTIEVDKGQLTQVILNLVENARDAIAGKEDGKIVVTTRKGDAGDRVELVVEDNGPGVPSDIRDRVFTPYFTTKHAKGGTGLGLAIVHRIISDHGGRIVIAEAAGGGARMLVELPLRPGQLLLASRV